MSCCDKTESGLGPDGDEFILSINADSTQDQLIIGAGGITVGTNSGTTTITGPTGTITTMTAPQMFVSPVVSAGSQLQLAYSGEAVHIGGNGSGSMLDTRINTVAGTSVITGYFAQNDTVESIQTNITSSTNSGTYGAKRGYIQVGGTNSTGLTIDVSDGTGKNIKLMTNSSVRGTIDDNGYQGAIGQTTPATNTSTDITLSVTPLSVSNGGTAARSKPACFDNLAPTTGNKGNLIVWNGSNNVNFAGSGADDTLVLTHDSSTSTGVKWAAATAPANSVVGFQAQTTSAASIPDSTSTKVSWTDIILDTNAAWNSGTHQYIIPGTGVYYISAQILFVNDYAAYDAEVTIVKNGSTVLQTGEIYHAAISSLGNPMVQGVFSLATSDTIQINVYQNSGSAQLLDGVKIVTTFNIASLGGVVNTSGLGTVTSIGLESLSALLTVTPTFGGGSNPITSNGNFTIDFTGVLPVAQGGTGSTTINNSYYSLAPSPAGAGSITVYNQTSNTWVNLASSGSAGQQLVISPTPSVGTGLIWQTPVATTNYLYLEYTYLSFPVTSLNLSSGIYPQGPNLDLSANSTVNLTQSAVIAINAGSGYGSSGIFVTLPFISSAPFTEITILVKSRTTNNSNQIFVGTNGSLSSDKFEGVVSGYITLSLPYSKITLKNDGISNWFVTSTYFPRIGFGLSLYPLAFTGPVVSVNGAAVSLSGTWSVSANYISSGDSAFAKLHVLCDYVQTSASPAPANLGIYTFDHPGNLPSAPTQSLHFQYGNVVGSCTVKNLQTSQQATGVVTWDSGIKLLVSYIPNQQPFMLTTVFAPLSFAATYFAISYSYIIGF